MNLIGTLHHFPNLRCLRLFRSDDRYSNPIVTRLLKKYACFEYISYQDVFLMCFILTFFVNRNLTCWFYRRSRRWPRAPSFDDKDKERPEIIMDKERNSRPRRASEGMVLINSRNRSNSIVSAIRKWYVIQPLYEPESLHFYWLILVVTR